MEIGRTSRKDGLRRPFANWPLGKAVLGMATGVLVAIVVDSGLGVVRGGEPPASPPAAAKLEEKSIPLEAPKKESPAGQPAASPTGGAKLEEKTIPLDAPKKESPAGQAAAKSPTASPKLPVPAAAPRPRPALSPSMAALRDRVRAVRATHFQDPLNTNDNTPSQILKFCLAFGCDTEIRYGSVAGGAMSGIGALCYNYPCGGYRLLVLDKDKPVARVGYGLQDCPGELLAMLAQSSVPESYELRIGTWRGKVADLVEAEKLSCVAGGDLSQKLIGLSHYLPHDAAWKNARGDAWSFERMVREELHRTPAADSADATNHLLGLASVLERRVRAGQPVDGQYERARKFLDEYQTFAFSLQNSDGSWNPAFFGAKGTGRDVAGSLRATGRILEWLCVSLPAERLEDRPLVLAVTYLVSVLENYFAPANVVYASPREIDGLMHALHALRLYDHRVFKLAEPPKVQQPANSKTPETQI